MGMMLGFSKEAIGTMGIGGAEGLRGTMALGYK
jgi:hypothetical protein